MDNASPTIEIAPAPWLSPSGWAWLIGLIGWCLLLFFHDLHGGAYFEPTDCWVAQTAREMQEQDHWLIPQFSGEQRYQKSPGAYWAVMLGSKLLGRPVDEIATRLPNALSATVMVFIIFVLTRRIAGERAAIFAGYCAASSAMLLYWSHRGASDLGLAALMTLSLASLWLATAGDRPRWQRNALWMVGYFSAGLAMLYKMPMPLVCVGLPAFIYVLARRQWSIFNSRWHLLGLALFLLPWLPWALAVLFSEPTALAKWRVEFLDRFTGDLPNVEGQRRLAFHFIYLLTAALFTLPYALSLPQALARVFRRDGLVQRDGMWFMFIWFVSLLIFFTASAGKEQRYLLPAMPPLFVLLGIELAHFFDPRRQNHPSRVRWACWAIWTLIPLGFIAGGIWGLPQRLSSEGGFIMGDILPPYIILAGLISVGCALAAWLFQRQQKNVSFIALVSTVWLGWLWGWSTLLPLLVSQAPMREFADLLVRQVPAEQRAQLRWIGSQDSRVIWYSNVRIPRIVDQMELLRRQGGQRSLQREIHLVAEEMITRLGSPEPILLVITREDYDRFMRDAPAELAKQNRTLPPTYIWFESTLGSRKRHLLVFSNQPPPNYNNTTSVPSTTSAPHPAD
ncbi:MAG: Undecaprenyl phosphate-alpha-4-amino-4-deoxy-L-arabinose arabinosyl transferase [Phycisphaerae bacterium]|nr:Undecaprenyl phosphate-alpha-4-amino-4-deoxy-L-arabinose arabinosyl transferase [Phycisphaerae bacterium]